MGKFKKILFQDVENPNESADGPITLRIRLNWKTDFQFVKVNPCS